MSVGSLKTKLDPFWEKLTRAIESLKAELNVAEFSRGADCAVRLFIYAPRQMYIHLYTDYTDYMGDTPIMLGKSLGGAGDRTARLSILYDYGVHTDLYKHIRRY